MAQPLASPFPIVGPQYCNNQQIVLVFLPLANGDVVADVNGSIKFVAKELHRTFAPNRWIIYDIAGNPILTVKPKVFTAHSRCEIFRGDSEELRDLIFTAKEHSMVSLKTKLDVFLAKNEAKKSPDFKVEGSFSEKSCTIYAGDKNPIIIAEKKNEQNVDNVLLGEGNFMVTAYSNVDCAFIVALTVILEGLERKYRATSTHTTAMDTANSVMDLASALQS